MSDEKAFLKDIDKGAMKAEPEDQALPSEYGIRRKGMLVVISGFSGAGKGTLMKKLLSMYDNYSLSISATTRDPRPGEQDGRDYFFVGEERFREMIKNDELLEYARYVDHFYGTPKAYVEEEMSKGKDVILEIEIQGALKIKAKYPESVLIFVTTPSAKELFRRLKERGTESDEVIKKRLETAALEAVGVEAYDYLIVNGDLDKTVKHLHHLIEDQHMRASQQLEFLEELQKEIRMML